MTRPDYGSTKPATELSPPPRGPAAGVIAVPCSAPAPVVANGITYLGCHLAKGHEGQHEVVIRWER